MTVLATTRNPAKAAALTALGVDHVLIDDGDVARQVRAILRRTASTPRSNSSAPRPCPTRCASVRVHGVVCFTGMLSNEWTIKDFYPIDYLPRGVRLTAYGGDAADLPAACCRTSWTPSRPAGARSRSTTSTVRPDRRGPRGHGSQPATGKLVVLTGP